MTHMLQIHHKVKPFKCDECDFTCATTSNLNNHRKNKHSASNKLKLSHFGDDLTWRKVESMFSAPTVQENSNIQENSVPTVQENPNELNSEVSTATTEDGEIAFWENSENKEFVCINKNLF